MKKLIKTAIVYFNCTFLLFVSYGRCQVVSGEITILLTSSTIAGTGQAGYGGDGGAATSAELNGPAGVAIDSSGNLYVADTGNNRVRRVDYQQDWPYTILGTKSSPKSLLIQMQVGTIITTINSSTTEFGTSEFPIMSVSGCVINGTAINPAGTICTIQANFTPQFPGIRTGKLSLWNGDKLIATLGLSGIGGGVEIGQTPGQLVTIAGQGNVKPSSIQQAASSSKLTYPYGVATDMSGNIFIADTENNAVEEINAISGNISIIAGGGYQAPSNVPQPGTAVALYAPTNLAVDPAGNVYIADLGNNLIEKLDASSGTIVVIAGGGSTVPSINGMPATQASLYMPYGVAVSNNGDLYISDSGNGLIEKVIAESNEIVAVAGGGYSIPTINQQNALAAFITPYGIAVDDHQHIFVADFGNDFVEEVDPHRGVIQVVAGGGGSYPGVSPVSATDVALGSPYGVAVDAAGNVYIADEGNSLIEKLEAASGSLRVIAGSGTVVPTSIAISSLETALQQPISIASDGEGNLVVAEFQSGYIDTIQGSTTLRFASTPVGQVSSPMSVWLANNGNLPFGISSITSASDFPVQSGKSCTFTASSGGNLPAGESCELQYTFQPQSSGTFTESAVIQTQNIGVSANNKAITLIGAAPPAQTTMTVSASPSTGTYGSSVTMTAVVHAGQGIPAGTVTFTSAAQMLGTVPLNSSGEAALSLSQLPVGSDVVTASYGGSSGYAPATASTTIIISAAPSVELVTSLNPNEVFLARTQIANTLVSVKSTGPITGTLAITCDPAPGYLSCEFPQSGSPRLTTTLTDATAWQTQLAVALNYPSSFRPVDAFGQDEQTGESQLLASVTAVPYNVLEAVILMLCSLRRKKFPRRYFLFISILVLPLLLVGCANLSPTYNGNSNSSNLGRVTVKVEVLDAEGNIKAQSTVLLTVNTKTT